MLKYKKIILLFFIMCIPLFILGCNKIDVRSETVINNNESGKINLYVNYPDTLKEYINGNIFNYDWAEQNGYEVKKYIEGNTIREELIYKFKNLEELEKKMNSSGLITLSHKNKFRCNKKEYDFNLVVNKSNIEKLLSKSIHTGDKTKDKLILKYIENINLHNDIKYCNCNVRTNSTKIINKIDLWNCKLSQFEDGDSIRFYIQ